MRHGTFTRPSAWIPLAMSFAAFCIVVGDIVFFGAARERDEGTAAHLFQLLIASEIPIMAFVAVKWLRHAWKDALVVLVSQALAIAAAIAPVLYFNL
ncbi:hypothetical protein EKH79_15160 [Dyella dinghuensis]|uniref:Uncharacterized protein n=1 Tax=Dyella dinghuensis TaxID=1920169 RepID=A0A432LPW5_9GAMM|nr:hypothetical protein [Dyella dinghuensis]RUL62222.1 hypothetical protein EKH79_15160 [Dyella dinghuensis]